MCARASPGRCSMRHRLSGIDMGQGTATRQGRAIAGKAPRTTDEDHGQPVDLSVQIGSLKLANPVMSASGCFGYGVEYADAVDLSSLGAVVVKGLFLEERK